jgi:hypothetical protein
MPGPATIYMLAWNAHPHAGAREKSLKNFRSVPRRVTSTPGRLAARKIADECLISGDN